MDLLNKTELVKRLKGIYENDFKKIVGEDSPYKDSLHDHVDEWAERVAGETIANMKIYCKKSDTSIPGNFKDVRHNYVWDKVNELLDFDQIVNLTLNTKEEDETAEIKAFRNWFLSWIFEAFGTFGLSYNFSNFLSEELSQLENEEE